MGDRVGINQIEEFILHPMVRKPDVGVFYACLFEHLQSDHEPINKIILKRWKMSGLEEIKTIAWAIWENKWGNRACIMGDGGMTFLNRKPITTEPGGVNY